MSAAVHHIEHEADEEVDEAPFAGVDHLQQLGINMGDIKKLQEAGILTVEAILMSTTKALCSIKGLSEAKVEKIRDAANKTILKPFKTGLEELKRRKKVIRITTGSSELDDLLGGGVETMSLTEVFGEFRTGKTQFCHTLAVTTQLGRDHNGGEGKVIYIDTEGTFRPERLVPIAERFGMDPEQTLDNIFTQRCYTHEGQMDLLVKSSALMFEEPIRLLIMDSSMALFRVDFSGRGELSERQQRLGAMLSKLSKLANEFNVAVVITNQVCADPSGAMFAGADAKKPIGGNVMAHASTTRLMLRKGRGEQRICKIYDSPCLPESECVFQIAPGGIENAKE